MRPLSANESSEMLDIEFGGAMTTEVYLHIKQHARYTNAEFYGHLRVRHQFYSMKSCNTEVVHG